MNIENEVRPLLPDQISPEVTPPVEITRWAACAMRTMRENGDCISIAVEWLGVDSQLHSVWLHQRSFDEDIMVIYDRAREDREVDLARFLRHHKLS